MFLLDYLFKNLALTLKLIARGEWRRVYDALHARIYQKSYGLIFWLRAPGLRGRVAPLPALKLRVLTDHPVAFASPDHQIPFGTKYNNSTNRKFVLRLDEIVRSQFDCAHPGFMDLGCSGGQLVKDFSDLSWVAVGLEGSDYSLKHRRANWRELANKNLFTCDITKPFQVQSNQQALKFHLITAWEVMEHIATPDLGQLLDNIRAHLVDGGYFIASTSSSTSIVDGVELHQTRLTNAEWHEFIAQRYPDLERADLGLRIYQYVRFDFGEPSFLVLQKTRAVEKRISAAAATSAFPA